MRKFRVLVLMSTMIFISIVLYSSCVTVVKIKDGDTAFERKQYALATSLLKKEYDNANNVNTKAHKAFFLGEAYRRLGEYENAGQWYRIAAENDYGYEALLNYGILTKQAGKFAEAKGVFQYLAQNFPGDSRIQKELTGIDILQAWEKDAENRGVEVENLDFNTSYAEYYPRRFSKNQILFLTDKPNEAKDQKYSWTGRDFSSLYLYDEVNNTVRNYDKVPVTKYNAGMATSDLEGNTIIYTICGDGNDAITQDEYCQLYIIEDPDSYYSEPKLLPFIEEGFNYIHPTLNEKGDLLIFSAFLPEGVGQYDLWYSRKINGQWQAPELLSNRINTKGDEMFPNLIKDTLYFSSNYLTGYGGLDIFKSYLRRDGTWSSPENLKSPINSGYDDMGFVPDYAYANKHNLDLAGYFSSNRPGGKGLDDIYFFRQKKIIPETPEEELPLTALQLNIRVKKKQFRIENQPNSGVKKLLNLPTATIEIDKGIETESIDVDNLGRVTIPIDTSLQYNFRISAENFLSKTVNFNPKGKTLPDRKMTTIVETVVLDSIFTNVEIVLKDIYYDFDKWDIREDARPTLDTLAMLLEDNPSLIIELSSHTDCRGAEDYNRNLSQKRAEAAVDYLIAQGISGERLTPIGYGESKPAVDCICEECTEEEHQQNRRTSFTILE